MARTNMVRYTDSHFYLIIFFMPLPAYLVEKQAIKIISG